MKPDAKEQAVMSESRWDQFSDEELLKLRYVLCEAGCTHMHADLVCEVDIELSKRTDCAWKPMERA